MAVIVAVVMYAVGFSAEGPTREGLVAAWEANLRADSQTTRLEAIGGGRYAFATERFPFDGTLEIVEVVIDDRSADAPFGMVVGHVAVELIGVDDDFRKRHATSLGLWHGAHVLYWSEDESSWIDARTWGAQVQDEYGGWSWFGWLSSGLWIILLLVMIVVLWWLSRRAGRQMKQAMAQQQHALEQQDKAVRMQEEMFELAQDSNRVLTEILEEVRAASGRSRRNDP
jgi:hypothetical protein